ncbi:MAG: molecular chaperone TorD family protein [Gaiellales bacterium]
MSVLAVDQGALCGLFATVLSYPASPPGEAARACATEARAACPEAAELLDAFARVADDLPPGVLEEGYTRTFDLDTLSRSEPTCYPYVGHYLFDESHKRGAFILGLRKRFRAAGFSDDGELADHLVVLLRFLATHPESELAEELVCDALVPALSRIGQVAAAADEAGSPARTAYVGVLRALELVLRAARPELEPEPLTIEIEREWARNRDSLGIDRAWCGH